jgi:hypothetical protein
MNIKDWLNATRIKMTISKNWIELIGWSASAFMVAFSFTLYIPLALVGLSGLTFQAYKTQTYNLVALNVISFIGFFMQFI